MTYRLSQEPCEQYEEGLWAAWRIEEDILEDLERARVTEAVAVIQPDASAVLFWVSAKGSKI